MPRRLNPTTPPSPDHTIPACERPETAITMCDDLRVLERHEGAGPGNEVELRSVVAAFEAGDPSRLVEREPGSSNGQATSSASDEPQTDPSGPASAPDAVAEEAVGGEPRGRDGLTAAERESIRAWAVNEGIEVKARGQLKKDLVANYEAWSARQR